MYLGIDGRVALVMGAGGGLGAAISASLAREGARVAGGGRDQEALERTGAAIRSQGAGFLAVSADLAQPATLDAALATVESALGPVEILINNTGGPPPGPVVGVAAEQWRRHFDAMVASVFHLTDAVLPGMRRRGWGRVITSTSSGVVAPIPNLGISNTLRSALVAWSKTLAGEVGRDGVTSNIVLPGRIATSRVVALDHARSEREGRPVEDVTAQSIATIPIGRYGSPEEYGDAVAFLASERASYITGSVIRVDGGMIPSV
ncbi:SDR family oxidoreductase [Blastococcus saxobsidens]|uniref:3-oxoacyl-[acyl-carrier protein] reductase n=1 Tax=Blastococcus saxobsidens TaxID=138336 RepID=A0A4Q7Y396_9ACTN|nr:SDR family oxidoreductase [Blastococcus saxobsidens]RZU31008.1 3-oxoacyl-[acyl-carrier protein] reductase [Blastococcus saxobsidens]